MTDERDDSVIRGYATGNERILAKQWAIDST
jgi:hypothetical protein